MPYLSQSSRTLFKYRGGYFIQPEEPDSPSKSIAATLSGFSNFITLSKCAIARSPHSSTDEESADSDNDSSGD